MKKLKVGIAGYQQYKDRTMAIARGALKPAAGDRKSTRLNSSHLVISYAVFCLKKENQFVACHDELPYEAVPVAHKLKDRQDRHTRPSKCRHHPYYDGNFICPVHSRRFEQCTWQ